MLGETSCKSRLSNDARESTRLEFLVIRHGYGCRRIAGPFLHDEVTAALTKFHFRRDGLNEFIIESLGQIGDARSVSVLKTLVEDVDLGPSVVVALEKLQGRPL